MITWVSSQEEAKTFPVLPGDTKLLMSLKQNVFYIKAVDAQGNCTFETYIFEKEV